MHQPSLTQNKLKFLFIARDKFPPFRVDVSTLFGEELVGRGHKIDWLLQSEQHCDSSFCTTWRGGKAWIGATTAGSTRISRLRQHFRSISNDLRMFGISRNESYDVIQVRDKLIAGLFAIVASKLSKTRFVYWLSFPIPEAKTYRAQMGLSRFPIFDYIRGHVFGLLLYRIIMPMADHIFVQSEQMKRDVEQKGINGNKLTAVPMGVSIENVRLEDSPPHTNEKIILYLGDISKIRGMGFLLRVQKKVLEQIPDAKLYLVGSAQDPNDVIELQNESERLGIASSVIFTGFVEKEEVCSFIRRASLCVSPLYPTPIYKPASPTKLIEYMANEKAVVVNDHPEQKQVITDSGGGLCVPYEESSFSRAVIELLENPVKAAVMGRKGRKYVEKYRSYNVIADIVEQQYLSLCK